MINKQKAEFAVTGGATNLQFEFGKNNTATMSALENKTRIKKSGLWVYDSVKKIIKMEIGGRGNIISVSTNRLELREDPEYEILGKVEENIVMFCISIK